MTPILLQPVRTQRKSFTRFWNLLLVTWIVIGLGISVLSVTINSWLPSPSVYTSDGFENLTTTAVHGKYKCIMETASRTNKRN